MKDEGDDTGSLQHQTGGYDMGMTMSQKILASHAGLEEVKAGQLIEADLDLVLGNDITTPVAIDVMKGFSGNLPQNTR